MFALRAAGAFLVFGMAVWGASFAQAQNAGDLAKIEKQVEQQKAAAAKLEQKEQKTAGELEGLRGRLVSSSEALLAKQAEQDELEDKLAELEKDAKQRGEVLSAARRRLADLTGALTQLSREPPILFALRETSAADQVHRAVLLRSLLPQLRDETESLLGELESYEQLQNKTKAQRKLAVAARQNLQWQKHNLDQLVRARQGLLARTQGEKDAIAKQLSDLSAEAKDLRQLMDKVSKPEWSKAAGKGEKGGKAPALRAGLQTPVAGKVVRVYGAKDDFGVASDGMVFAGEGGAPVLAPQSGRVVFSGPFKGYGNVVILQHTGGTHSFLSGFGRIDAEMGQSIAAGEPLGILPAAEKSELYFEWRQNGEAKDPTASGLTLRARGKKS